MKSKNLTIIFIVLAALVPSTAQQTEITGSFGNVELEINENGLVKVTQDIEFLAYAEIYQADITIPAAKDLKISDSSGNLEYDSIPADDEEIINFYFSRPLNPGEKRVISIEYFTEFFTNKKADTWELSFSLKVSNRSTIKAVFPENVVISFTASEIIPSTYIENERQVLELESLGDVIDFLCEYKFIETGLKDEKPVLAENKTGVEQINLTEDEAQKDEVPADEQEIPAPEQEPMVEANNYALILFVVIILLVALIYYLKLRKPGTGDKKEKEKEEIEEPEKAGKVKPSIIKLLNENEKKIVAILEKADGEVTQAYIYKSTKIPRSTLSKIMAGLEERNMVVRRSEGKTRWVRLKEWVFD